MKINCTSFLKDLGGKDIEGQTTGQTIAKILVGEQSKDPLRSYVLAQKFYSDVEVEVNESDWEFLEKSIKDCKLFTPLALGQLLMLKEEPKKK